MNGSNDGPESWHPEHPGIADLGMKWYSVPAVSALEVTVGGILYPCIPFNGWYADTEVVRDLIDEDRYDKLEVVARVMGLDVSANSTLWRDEAQLAVNKAVLHSYQHAGVAMVRVV